MKRNTELSFVLHFVKFDDHVRMTGLASFMVVLFFYFNTNSNASTSQKKNNSPLAKSTSSCTYPCDAQASDALQSFVSLSQIWTSIASITFTFSKQVTLQSVLFSLVTFELLSFSNLHFLK